MLESRPEGSRVRKVLLVFPPTRVGTEQILACMPPLGAMYLAAVFRDSYEVEILDCTAEGFDIVDTTHEGFKQIGLGPAEIEERIRRAAPDVVGVTCLFSSSYPAVEQVVNIAKKVDPEIATIVGGTHPTFLARKCLESNPNLDFIVMGEGEISGKELLRRLNAGEGFEGIDGLAYRDGDEVKIAPKTHFIEDLDSLPFPARDLVPLETYARANRAHGVYSKEPLTTTIQSSRGCPAKCTFCSSMRFWGQKYRGRSAENVIAEIEEVRNTYGIKEFQFEDDNLTMDRTRAKTLFNALIDRELDVSWSTPNGVAIWTLDEEILRLMKRSGCYQITLAFESGNQRVLRDVVKKPTNLKHAEKVVQAVKKVGLDHNAFFIMGFPGEKKEEMKDSYNLAKRLKLQSAWFFVANPLPGTELYEQCDELGLLSDDYDPTNTAYTRSNFRTPDWTSDEVEKLAQSSLIKIQLWSHLREPWHHLKHYLARPQWTLYLGSLLVKRLWRRLTLLGRPDRRAGGSIVLDPKFSPAGERQAIPEGGKRPRDWVPKGELTIDVREGVRLDEAPAPAQPPA